MGTKTEVRPDPVAGLAVRALREAVEGLSHDDIRRLIGEALASLGEDEQGWRAYAREVFDDAVVYEWGGTLWRAPYTITEGAAELGESVEVRVTYTPVDASASEALTTREPTPERAALVKALDESPAFREDMRAVIEHIESGGLVDLVEANPTPIRERAIRGDGTALVKLIEPGWGSTGYYAESVLKRDVPEVFPAGTKMFWDHPTDREARERPEGSLEKLAAELVETPRFLSGQSAPQGDGMYARAKVFERFRGVLDDLAGHIGVSIRGRGRTKVGTVEGRNGPIVDELTEGVSVDFVTMPGAGGAVVEMFEAAGRRPVHDPEGEDMDELSEARQRAETAESKVTEAEQRAAEAIERAQRAELAVAISTAKVKAREAVAKVKLPDVARDRIVEKVAGNPPLTEAGELDVEALEKAATDEAEAERRYLASATPGGRVRDLGESERDDAEATSEADDKALEAEYEALADTLHLGDKVREGFLTGRR